MIFSITDLKTTDLIPVKRQIGMSGHGLTTAPLLVWNDTDNAHGIITGTLMDNFNFPLGISIDRLGSMYAAELIVMFKYLRHIITLLSNRRQTSRKLVLYNKIQCIVYLNDHYIIINSILIIDINRYTATIRCFYILL